jgi:cobalamin biosynthesis Mg chelatase CobN
VGLQVGVKYSCNTISPYIPLFSLTSFSKTYRSLPIHSRHLSILRSNEATFSGNEARNSTTVTIQAITSHESKKMTRAGGQSGTESGEDSRSDFPGGVAVVEAIVEVAREVAMLCSTAVGVWKVVMWAVGALVLVLVLAAVRVEGFVD